MHVHAPNTLSAASPVQPLASTFLARFTVLVALVLMAMQTACNPFAKKAPELEQLMDADSMAVLWWDVAATPMDWEKIRKTWQQHEPAMRDALGDGFSDSLESAGIQPEDFSKFILVADTLDFSENGDIEEALLSASWILGIDLNGYLAADVLAFAINAQSARTGLTARQSSSESPGFERVDLNDTESDTLRYSIAVFAAETTQLRIGTPERVLRSIHAQPDDRMPMPEPTLAQEPFWFLLNTPEALAAQAREWESALPIDTGMLLSGFESLRIASQWNGQALESVVSLNFESIDGADTAYSILNLAHRFAFKPVLRKSIGDADHFLRSLRLERRGTHVHYRSRLNPEDAAVIQAWAERMNASPVVQFALDLIQTP